MLMSKHTPYKVIDLFAGAGGFTLGFTSLKNEHGLLVFQPVWANDFNKHAVNTYNANFGDHCVHGNIVDILENPDIKIPSADVVVGGPPCQGFSLLNKNRSGDPRTELWRPFMDVVARSGAKVFVMENVPQLLRSEEFEQIVAHARILGFQVSKGDTLIAADYGVPQTRRRAFIVGSKYCDPNILFPPPPTHRSLKDEQSDLPIWSSVRDAIGDLPPPVGTQLREDTSERLRLHFGRNPTEKSKARYRAIPEEGMNRFDLQRIAPEITPACWIRKKSGGTDLFGRLWWDRPSVTIRTEFFKPEKGRYLHPVQHRPITHREAARFQSFPDDFVFHGSKIEIARQIGNAVPPLLAQAVARSIRTILDASATELIETQPAYVQTVAAE